MIRPLQMYRFKMIHANLLTNQNVVYWNLQCDLPGRPYGIKAKAGAGRLKHVLRELDNSFEILANKFDEAESYAALLTDLVKMELRHKLVTGSSILSVVATLLHMMS